MAQFVVDRRFARPLWRRRLAHLDVALVATTLVVSGIGVLMVYTATRGDLLHAGSSPTHFLKRQAVWSLAGLVVMVVVAAIDYHRFERLAYPLYGLLVVGLIGIFAVGKSALGAARWYQLGPLHLQPSAFGALALILAVAAYCHHHHDRGITLPRVGALLAMAGVPVLLVVKQPDIGSAIVMVMAFIAMLIVAGVRARYLVAMGVLGLVGAVLIVKLGILHQYQTARLTTFLNPHTPGPAGYTLRQSKIAVGSGGLFGQGLFRAPQTNLGYVPEQYTDFIFTAVGEQLGFVGSAALLGVFALMVWRLLRTAQLAQDQFGRILCAGVLGYIGFSVFQNAGMTLGLMPITGIPLPFVSYGGSATLAFFAAIGLAINVGMRRTT